MRTGSNKVMRMGSDEVSAERGGDEFNYGWTVNDGGRRLGLFLFLCFLSDARWLFFQLGSCLDRSRRSSSL